MAHQTTGSFTACLRLPASSRRLAVTWPRLPPPPPPPPARGWVLTRLVAYNGGAAAARRLGRARVRGASHSPSSCHRRGGRGHSSAASGGSGGRGLTRPPRLGADARLGALQLDEAGTERAVHQLRYMSAPRPNTSTWRVPARYRPHRAPGTHCAGSSSPRYAILPERTGRRHPNRVAAREQYRAPAVMTGAGSAAGRSETRGAGRRAVRTARSSRPPGPRGRGAHRPRRSIRGWTWRPR